jgi:hypothetical protein
VDSGDKNKTLRVLFLRKNKGRLCEARRGRPPFFFKAGGDPEGMARPRSTDRSGRALSLYPFLWEKLRESARAREKKKLSLCKGKLKKYVYGG